MSIGSSSQAEDGRLDDTSLLFANASLIARAQDYFQDGSEATQDPSDMTDDMALHRLNDARDLPSSNTDEVELSPTQNTMLSGQTSTRSVTPAIGIAQAFHTPKSSKRNNGRVVSEASLPGRSPPNRVLDAPITRWNPDDDIVPASSSPPHHIPPSLKKVSLSSSVIPSPQLPSSESAQIDSGEQHDLPSAAQPDLSTDDRKDDVEHVMTQDELEADGLEATLASKESDSFVESLDKRMLDQSRQDVQLTGLLEHIRASRPAPPRRLKASAESVTVRDKQPVDKSSRLDALPTYRRLGRTSEPQASTSTQPVRNRVRSKIEVSSESNSESSPEPEPVDDETYRPLGAVVPQKRPITYGNSGRTSKKAKHTVDVKPISRVFARWARDRAYYPGTIKAQNGKRVTVFYDDEQTAEVDANHLRRCELKPGDAVMDLSCRPFKDVHVLSCSSGSLRKDDEIRVASGGREYPLRVFQIKIREKHLAQMDDRTAETTELTVDAVWTQPAPRTVNGLKAVTPARRSASTSIQSSPSRCDRRDTDLFGGLGFLITSPSQNEEQRKRKVAKRILAHGGTCANEIWDFYEKPTMDDLSRGWEAIELKSDANQLRGVFLIVIGTPTLTPKYLMALALGVPCLSANFVDEAITTGAHWSNFLLSSGPSLYLEAECSQFVDPRWGSDPAVIRQKLDNSTVTRRPFWGKEVMIVKDSKMNDIIPYCAAAMGADIVAVVNAYEHGNTDISDVDVVVFTDNAVPEAMFNGRKTATVEWVKQCLIMGMFQPPRIYNKSR